MLAAPLDALRAQALDSVPRPLVSQPMLAMQAVDKARAHWRAGRLAQALQAIEAGLREEPQDLSLRFMRGSLLYESGRVDESRLQFIELAEQFPELAEIHNNLASLHARAG
ncbi:MAG: tetratricopeptide repeat protein, partial [Betaproteobacteria bacterium]|nr:tetratricopeptide repeat protein [Betaproteobacteria bacterium]